MRGQVSSGSGSATDLISNKRATGDVELELAPLFLLASVSLLIPLRLPLAWAMATRAEADYERTYLTDPNMAASQSFLRMSIVSWGRATPVFWNTSQPASRGTNLGVGMSDPRARRTASAAGRTSLPAGHKRIVHPRQASQFERESGRARAELRAQSRRAQEATVKKKRTNRFRRQGSYPVGAWCGRERRPS